MRPILVVAISVLMLSGCASSYQKSAANCPRDGSHLAKNCGEARTFGSMYRGADTTAQ